jgi:cytochrome c oxidase subunit 2
LHVPIGQPVRLVMTSEDVIHSFYVPAFRTKMDVLPGRYTTIWFEATKVGEYHLFCAEYCGNEHSRMGGKVVVMEAVDYERWISGEGAGESMAQRGERLFTEMRCDTCHQPEGTGRGPSLEGIFGSVVALENRQSVTADESYIRESILNPTAKVVAGFRPVMPTFQGQVNEEQLLQIIAYLKTLGAQEQPRPAAGRNRGSATQ